MDEHSNSLTLVIITAESPDRVAACISSYVTGERAPASILLTDDSRDPACAIATKAVAANLTSGCRVPIRYASRRDREDFVKHLSEHGIDKHVASFGLLGMAGWFTAGANRNAALLDSGGEKILMADDDTSGQTATCARAPHEIILAAHDDPSDIRFFKSRKQAFAAAAWEPVDIFGRTSELLGARLDDLKPTTDGSCRHLLDRMRDGSGVVRTVSFGTVGDSGFYSPVHLLWSASRSTFQTLNRSEEALETALSSREVIRMSPRTTITHGTVCMATAIGLDNRHMRPPFLPIGRNEDGFFGNLLVRCFPADCAAHLPFSIVHQPPEGRAYARLPDQPQTIRLSELIILLLSSCRAGAGVGSGDALRVLGSSLRDLANSPRGFAVYAREVVGSARRRLLHDLEDRWLSCEGQSPRWKRETSQLLRRLRELADSPDCWIPMELTGVSEQDMEAETRRIVNLTGEFLVTWPDMVEVTRRLRDRDIRISRISIP